MSEIVIDISGHHSKSVDEFIGQEFEYVITVCDHANEDPAHDEDSFREVRDQIRARIYIMLRFSHLTPHI